MSNRGQAPDTGTRRRSDPLLPRERFW